MEKEKKKIFGFTIWRLLVYFIIYSIVGFLVETVFGLITKGVLESRKSFLYGPFCSIYGLGAIIMIVSLQKYNKNNYTLFIAGFVIGSIVEYIISLVGEMIFHIKWWDYSNETFNINGRICVTFSIFWGLLAIYLMSHFNPLVDKMINKIKTKIDLKYLKILVVVIMVFIIFDLLITGYALKIFFARLIYNNNLNLENSNYYISQYEKVNENEQLKEFTNKFFSNKKMLKTFPNLKVKTLDDEIIFIKDVLSDIQPYYLKIFNKKSS